MKRIAGLLLLLALSGCASMEDEMNAWRGHTQAELIEKWGPPMSVSSDGQGGTILYYSHAAGYSSTQIWMYANKDGMLYYWRTRQRNW